MTTVTDRITQLFTALLAPGEQLVWAGGGNPVSIRRALLSYARTMAGLAVAVAVLAGTSRPRDPLESGLLALLMMAALGAAGAPLVVLFQMWQRTRLPERLYAVTSHRLLLYHRGQDQVFAALIRDLPPVIAFAGTEGRGTLSFGAAFPNFTDIADSATVHRLIVNLQAAHAAARQDG
ncbi:MAG: hypothetical protein MUE40_11905 [Anaerolineae bacterium]|nr:hypothetical protein [Anaerolineae bacterium]